MVDDHHDVDRVTGLLLEELLRSARNKGCTVVEAIPLPDGVMAGARDMRDRPAGRRTSGTRSSRI